MTQYIRICIQFTETYVWSLLSPPRLAAQDLIAVLSHLWQLTTTYRIPQFLYIVYLFTISIATLFHVHNDLFGWYGIINYSNN